MEAPQGGRGLHMSKSGAAIIFHVSDSSFSKTSVLLTSDISHSLSFVSFRGVTDSVSYVGSDIFAISHKDGVHIGMPTPEPTLYCHCCVA